MDSSNIWEPPVFEPENMLETKARIFHASNPHVLALAESLAAEALKVMPKIGMKMIWERMRWHFAIDTYETSLNPDTGEPLKLNNIYHAYYARWLLIRNPAWFGRIRIRQTGAGRNDTVTT